MEAAWFFIATAWLISMGIYASIFIADDKIPTAIGKIVLMFAIMLGSFWVPELWL